MKRKKTLKLTIRKNALFRLVCVCVKQTCVTEMCVCACVSWKVSRGPRKRTHQIDSVLYRRQLHLEAKVKREREYDSLFIALKSAPASQKKPRHFGWQSQEESTTIFKIKILLQWKQKNVFLGVRGDTSLL